MVEAKLKAPLLPGSTTKVMGCAMAPVGVDHHHAPLISHGGAACGVVACEPGPPTKTASSANIMACEVELRVTDGIHIGVAHCDTGVVKRSPEQA